MTVIFGQKQNAKLFLPKGSSAWDLKDFIKKGEYENIFLLSFSIKDSEIVDVRRCFDETTHIFAFGRNPVQNVMQVSFLMYLYNGCKNKKGKKWAKIDDIRKAYDKQRVYKKTDVVEIKIDDLTVYGFLIDMTVSDVNPVTKTAVISFTFVVDQEV